SDRIFGAEDGLAQWLVLPEILGEDLMYQIIWIVLVHLDLFEDHALLSADVVWLENRIQDEVTEHVHRDGHVLIENLCIEADAFLSGEGVHVAADGVHLAGDIEGGSRLRPFEDHVLHEVRNAIDLRVFMARAGLY